MDRAIAYLKEVLAKYKKEAVATALIVGLLAVSCAGFDCARVSNIVTPVQNATKAAQKAYCTACKESCP